MNVSKSVDKVICKMFPEIEARREKAGIDQIELCKRAGVHPTSYSARKSGRSGMNERTLKKLVVALDALVAEKLVDVTEASREEQPQAAE